MACVGQPADWEWDDKDDLRREELEEDLSNNRGERKEVCI